MGRYDDMILLPHHVSKRHPPMPRADRAKQFMPFAALKGYDEAISDKQIIYEPRMELGDEQRDRLDDALLRLHEKLRGGERPRVRLLCFVPRQDGVQSSPPLGQYVSRVGTAEKMNLEDGRLRLDGRWLPLEDVMELAREDGEQF
ncbi:MAG: hypothetical protein IJ157_04085 [Clostridia bacterium]|nr:hypothetical protein [Clostridia bacterium]